MLLLASNCCSMSLQSSFIICSSCWSLLSSSVLFCLKCFKKSCKSKPVIFELVYKDLIINKIMSYFEHLIGKYLTHLSSSFFWDKMLIIWLTSSISKSSFAEFMKSIIVFVALYIEIRISNLFQFRLFKYW